VVQMPPEQREGPAGNGAGSGVQKDGDTDSLPCDHPHCAEQPHPQRYCLDELRFIRECRERRQAAAARLAPLSSGHRDPNARRTDGRASA